MKRASRLALAATLAATLAAAAPAHALRVATYNMLGYQVGTLGPRQDSFRTVMAGLNPDLLITQELNEAAAKDSFLVNVLNVVQPGEWTGTWLALGTEGGAIFWKPAKVSVSNISTIANPTGPRPFLVGLVKPVGYLNNGAWFRIYSVHLKAGNPASSPADSTTRRTECTTLRTTLNNTITTVVGPNFLVGGDTNFYGTWEGGYVRLVESQLDNDGRGFDPLNLPGTWNNSGYAVHHTQSPRAASGGMDDRFDLFVTSQGLQDGSGLDLLPFSYLAYGNDGQHYNQDIDGGGFNTAVGLAIATALRVAADHVPALLQLQLPAKISAASRVAFGDVLVGAAATQPLLVANVATAPADLLRYSFTAPAAFSAPAGSFSVAAGAGPAVHLLGLDTATPAALAGTLTVATNDVDSTSKPVQLAGRVLAHAVASLDSGTVVTAGTLDLGNHVAGEFTDLGVRVHDQGWNALQARLAVTGASITGGGGHFSMVGFAPTTFGEVGHTFTVRFDPAGASLDSTYSATLTFETADEALPGATAGSPLTLALRARVLGSVDDVAGGYSLRLLPPRPNPARQGTVIEFELPHEAPVELAIFDLGGRRIASLADGQLGAGHHSLRWNAQDGAGHRVPAGLYFVRFATPGLARVHRVALLP